MILNAMKFTHLLLYKYNNRDDLTSYPVVSFWFYFFLTHHFVLNFAKRTIRVFSSWFNWTVLRYDIYKYSFLIQKFAYFDWILKN